jgi:hypothetical protein
MDTLGMDLDDLGARWLLGSKDPSVRYFTLTDVLHESGRSAKVVAAKRQILKGKRLRALLSGQCSDGGFGVHQYRKWSGAHWRLVSAVELGVPAGYEGALKAANHVLSGYLARLRPPKVAGLWRSHASEPGNAVGACSRLGLASDFRVKKLALSLVQWQWPDGGWNCDSAESAHHSSFYESLATLWGLNEYFGATGDKDVGNAVDRACEFFLKHHLFRSCTSGAVINPEWLKLHYPLYWHYDILQALVVLSQAGKLGDPRTAEALDVVESKRSGDGTWRAEGYYWRPMNGIRRGLPRPNTEVADWGREGPNEMITLNALRVLVGSGRA